MDFGRILDDWEKIKQEHKDTAPSSAARASLEAWLDQNGTSDKDAAADSGRSGRGLEAGRLAAKRLAALKTEAALDLHGMTAEEAESSVAVFLEESFRAGLEKVLIIHGKGLHSTGSPVLKKAARKAIEAHSKAGRFGQADRTEGGSGALWVIIRKKS